MIIIGLTGGIASGKSTVARMLEEKGALLLDADFIAREVVLPGKPAWREIRDWLGPSITGPGGAIDRARLGKLIFSDPAARERLNGIVHPRVMETFITRTEEIRRRHPDAVVVYDVPLLIEAKMDRMVDLVVLVYAAEEIQLARLQSRDKLTAAEALSRLRAQMPLAEKRAYADVIIDNSGSLAETRRQLESFWKNLRLRSGNSPE
ncbi:MAG TPA: dephospho-CoA kinase [Bacillota bacterium]|mgnify:FL=1|jgi:dephospho-CoA kinase|nr:dephospho-CoA kinase [Bacillota bacterium]HOJ85047.1 dephospho-CoA kinase [Bacillota bacterium]HOL14924.1 dephospho-CoA kinase [Bacillota bacterium]HPZ11524.1 dephospho-CoA kinase [Bacillota bacterium]HQE09955.1 dephospho-CoA kinase [Bacillota bacterium]